MEKPETNGSKLTGFEVIRIIMSPPYCGLPRLSHQFPAFEVVGFVVGAIVGTVVDVVLVVIVVGVVAWVDVEVGVDVVQDARISDVTMRQVSNIQIVPLFILDSFFY
jgi:hypothetical protein